MRLSNCKINKLRNMIHQNNDYIKKTFNEVNTLTAVCKSRNSLYGGEITELEIGKRYQISHIGVLRSTTLIMLSEFGHNEYNSACFDIYENGKIIEYRSDTRFWAPYLRDMYLDGVSEIPVDEKE